MKTLVAVAILLAMLVPGAAFAGASTDAALGLGAFAVFNQIISGTGIFGAFHPAPGPVVVAPPVQERVVVREYHPVYVPPPVYYAPAPVYYYYAPPPVYYDAPPRRVFVIKERGWSPPGHAKRGHYGHGGYER
ncbi:MAG: hypothetical protein DMD95_03930 [Candidatus Rokuibacteriota bacterium]|nr:MAG: hypothetical protein DMD95_03930 [Candidatus Rokubacteria bacterium]